VTEELHLRVAGVTILVRSEAPSVTSYLRAGYGPSLISPEPPRLIYSISSKGHAERDGVQVAGPNDRFRVGLRVEGDFLGEISRIHRSRLALHAAVLRVSTFTWLITGPSGAGKSTMSRALVRLGAQYLTDDLAFVERGHMVGVGRAIQFDARPVRELSAVPHYLADCDTTSVRFGATDDDLWCAPLWNSAGPAVSEIRAEPRKTGLIVLGRGSTEVLVPLDDPGRRAAEALGASLACGSSDWTHLPTGPTLRGEWKDRPEELAARVFALAMACVETLDSP
jgi:hypothetical protein